MSLLGPRHSCLSGLAISNRSEPEAQGVVGSVVSAVTTLDYPRLQKVPRTQTGIWVLTTSLAGVDNPRRMCVYVSEVPKGSHGKAPLAGYQPLEICVAAVGVAPGAVAQDKIPIQAGSDPGPDGRGLQAE